MQDVPQPEPAFKTRKQVMDLVENELKLALTFLKVSSTAYSVGKLQHATDARSKAEAVRERAVAQLIESSATDKEHAASVQSILGEVQHALSRLPPSFELNFRVRRAS
jgi:hypothetical protein